MMMKAIQCDLPTEIQDLKWTEVSQPTAGENEVLIQIKAFGLNRADLSQRKGNYPPPPGTTSILGMEVAGVVVKIGNHPNQPCPFKLGDRVMALVTGGGYAEYVAAPTGVTFLIPPNLSFVEAASLPETMMVAYMTLFHLGHLKEGQKALLHGGSSGISSFAIQVCHSLNIRVATTVRNEGKKNYVTNLGADLAILYPIEDFATTIQNDARFGKVDFILDFVGRPYLQSNLSILDRFGTLVFINSVGGTDGSIDLRKMMIQCQTICGTVLRSRPLHQKIEFALQVQQQFLPKLISGELKATVGKVYSADEIQHAHRLMESSDHLGKLVIDLEVS